MEVERIHVYGEHPPPVLVEDEVLVSAVEVAQVVQRHRLLVVASAFLDVLHEMWHRSAQINHQVWQACHARHQFEEFHICLEITVGQVSHVFVVGREHINALEYGAVLDYCLLRLCDSEQVAEPLLEEEHLQCEAPSGDVLIVVLQIRIIGHRLEMRLPAKLFSQHFRECSLSASYVSCNCYVHIFINVATKVAIICHLTLI